jgi:succinate dehydrogenase/fumarate reductase cytochrome b subunit
MQVTEPSAAAKTEGVAHTRPSVEHWLCWSGLLPLPAFLLLHLGRELSLATATDVADVVRSTPSVFSVVTSALLVWLPLTVHATLGVWSLTSRSPAAATLEHEVEPPARRVSRLSSAVALLFVLYHARHYPLATLLGEADASDAGFRLLGELAGTRWGVPLRGAAYLLGLAATVAHGGLGVHRALLRLGILENEGRRTTSARLCTVVAALLFCVGAAAVIRVASGVLLR